MENVVIPEIKIEKTKTKNTLPSIIFNLLLISVVIVYGVLTTLWSNFWFLYVSLPIFLFSIIVFFINLRNSKTNYQLYNLNIYINKLIIVLIISLLLSIVLMLINNQQIIFFKEKWTVSFKTFKIGLTGIVLSSWLIINVFIIRMINNWNKENSEEIPKFDKKSRNINIVLAVYYFVALIPLLIIFFKFHKNKKKMAII